MYFVWKRVAVKQCAFFVFIGSQICLINTMNDYLEQFLLEVVKDHLKSLSDEQFLALSCNLTTLHDGLSVKCITKHVTAIFALLFVLRRIFLCAPNAIFPSI